MWLLNFKIFIRLALTKCLIKAKIKEELKVWYKTIRGDLQKHSYNIKFSKNNKPH